MKILSEMLRTWAPKCHCSFAEDGSLSAVKNYKGEVLAACFSSLRILAVNPRIYGCDIVRENMKRALDKYGYGQWHVCTFDPSPREMKPIEKLWQK